MKQSESIASLAPALVKALGEMRGVAKDSKNPHFKNDYASLEAVIDVARPVLGAHGLAFMQGLGEYAAGAMTVSTRILHESGEWIESDFQMPVSKADPQGTASASTYARRYSLMSILGLPAVDDDGEASMPRSTKPGEPKNPNVSVHPEGPDWYKTEGAGMSAAKAKAEGLGEKVNQWLGDLETIPTVAALRDWANENGDTIRTMPKGWRIEVREAFDRRGRELGAM
jgi:hypothetical protein